MIHQPSFEENLGVRVDNIDDPMAIRGFDVNSLKNPLGYGSADQFIGDIDEKAFDLVVLMQTEKKRIEKMVRG
jgi:hypothetical protein